MAKHHRVHLACFVDDPADFIYENTVRQLAGGECLFIPLNPVTKWLRASKAMLTGQPITTAYFGSAKLKRWINALAKSRPIDRVVVFSSAMAPYLVDFPSFDPAHAILDLVDIDSDKWRQYAAATRGPERWIFRREASALLRLERAAAQQFGATILVSDHEAKDFAALAPESASRIFALNNGVDLEHFAPGSFVNPFSVTKDCIVMTGRMDYRPNVDGAEWFIREVMPRIALSLPRASFYVVGAGPPRSLRMLAGPQIVLTGYVDDVRPYIQHAAVVVAPLRIARGTQNKVLEAMAMGKPVVATQAATRALTVSTGVHLWIENDPARFADAVIAAARGRDPSCIALNSRRYVEDNHDWQKTLITLDNLLGGLGNRPAEQNVEPPPASKALRDNSRPLPFPKASSVAGAEQ